MNKSQNIIWIDCEFTSIDYKAAEIIQIAIVVTDKDLNILKEPLSININHSDEKLNMASEWVLKTIPDVVQSSRDSDISIQQAEDMCLEYLSDITDRGISQMAGNSIGSDRHMLYYKMPKLEAWCHYRNIDVSTLKELAERWKPELLDQVKKKETHYALDDILESIEELRTYKKLFD